MNCQTCLYWWPFTGKKILKRTETERETAVKGECRRYPISKTSLESDMFPVSRVGQWCGEYKNFEASK